MEPRELMDNALVWLHVKFLLLTDICIWSYNWLRFNYLQWLDLSGIMTMNGHRYVYYTYEGQKYMILADKSRGPARRYPKLEEYYKDQPHTMVSLMGPNNDWHGRGDDMMKMLGLIEKKTENTATVGSQTVADNNVEMSGEVFSRENEL